MQPIAQKLKNLTSCQLGAFIKKRVATKIIQAATLAGGGHETHNSFNTTNCMTLCVESLISKHVASYILSKWQGIVK